MISSPLYLFVSVHCMYADFVIVSHFYILVVEMTWKKSMHITLGMYVDFGIIIVSQVYSSIDRAVLHLYR